MRLGQIFPARAKARRTAFHGSAEAKARPPRLLGWLLAGLLSLGLWLAAFSLLRMTG